MPDCSTGAVIMKMTSSTRTTSTSGVMLISASDERVWPLLLVKATFCLPRWVRGSRPAAPRAPVRARERGNLFQRVEQFPAEVVHSGSKHADARGELVVSDHGGDGDEEAGGRGDQRF
jgi:hypothetical protein